MTRIKLVLAQPKGFVLSELWQVNVAMTRRIINHLPIVSGDMTQRVETPAHRLWEHAELWSFSASNNILVAF